MQLKRINKEKVCRCEPKCEKFIRIERDDSVIRLCEQDAKSHAYDILETLGYIQRKQIRNVKPWTSKQEQVLIKWAEKGFQFGDMRVIGDLLGKTREQVKKKVVHMRKLGLIPKSEKSNSYR